MGFDISALFNPGARSLLGMDISASAVKLVELNANGKNGYRLDRYAVEVLPKDAVTDGNISDLDKVAECVRKAWQSLKTTTRNVALALPTSAVITRKIIVPNDLHEEELASQVENEAGQYIPFAIEEVNLDYQVIGPAPNMPDELEVFIAASKRDRVDDRVAVAEAAGLKALVMDTEGLAAQSAYELVRARLPDEGKDKLVALIDVGATTLRLSVLKNDTQVYTRDQAFGGNQLTQDICRHYGMDFDKAEEAKRKGSLPEGYESELIAPFLENLALEVSRSLQFLYTSTPYNNVDYIVLSGGCATLPDVVDVVATRTQVNTIVANPFQGMVISDKVNRRNLDHDAPLLMVACGLALRRFDPS